MPVDMAMQHCDIAISHNPFGVVCKAREVQAVHNAHRAVPPASTHNGLHLWGIEQLLNHSGTRVVIAGKLVAGVEQVVGQHHFKPPRAEQIKRRLQLFGTDFSCRSCNGYLVAPFQTGRNNNRGCCIHSIVI